MNWLIAGLVLFLGVHSLRLFADGFRSAQIARIGARRWKLIYTIVSLTGFAMLLWGFSQAQQTAVVVWSPPAWTLYVAAALTLIAFVLLAAAYVPGNRLKAKIGHPMVAGVKTWAIAHLFVAGTLADIALFGAFLIWSLLVFSSSRRRARAAGTVHPPGSASRDALTVATGAIAWAIFAFWLHGPLIGVRPFAG